MRKNVLRSFIILTVLLIMAVPVYGAQTASVSIPVTFTSNAPVDEPAVVDLNGDAGTQTLTIDRGQQAAFQLQYAEPGSYRYTITRQAGSEEYTQYDTSEFQLIVTVLRSGDGLSADAVLFEEGSEDKLASASYTDESLAPSEDEEPVPPTKEDGAKAGKKQTGALARIIKAVRTGDELGIAIYMVVLGFSGALLMIMKKGRRRHND